MPPIHPPFKGEPDAPIALESSDVHGAAPLHLHESHAFMMVRKGTCRYRFAGREIPLVPGDILLMPAHKPRGCIADKRFAHFSVRFYPGRLESRRNDRRPEPAEDADGALHPSILEQWNALSAPIADETDAAALAGLPVQAELSRFGILRLNPDEAGRAAAMLDAMHAEQQQRLPGHERVLRAYLEILLVLFSRVCSRQLTLAEEFQSSRKALIKDAIVFIEAHLAEPIRFEEIAKNSSLSPNYFRTVFKEATGMSPVD
ncbi:MAG: AraC family ligand binding domain-containing protein, partial [Clostridia bacterium]|nr:AraC family ligand binding domain-containing protein [Clostridia bacterium]